MTLTTMGKIQALSEKMARLMRYRKMAIEDYDRSPDGSFYKQHATERMADLSDRISEIEKQLDVLTDELEREEQV